MPNEDFIYFADSKYLPLGNKTEKQILAHALEAAAFLLKKKVKFLVVACNTTSSIALAKLKALLKIPVIGVIDPLLRELVKLRKTKIGIIATPATIKTGIYFKQLKRKMPASLVFEKACPLLVPLIEKGDFSSELLNETVKNYLRPLKQEKINLLALGCTHYPLIRSLFENFLETDVQIIDAACLCASEVVKVLGRKKLKAGLKSGSVKFYVSGKTESFQLLASHILGKTIEKVFQKKDNFSSIQQAKNEAF